MKRFLSVMLIASVSFLVSCTKEDPCAGVICLNGGTCSDGTCQCSGHFEGTSCESQELPSAIVVTKIEITRFPVTEPDGESWDIGSGADITLGIEIGSTTYSVENIYYENVTSQTVLSFEPEDPFEIEPLTEYSLYVLDYDEADPNDVMGGVSFTPYSDDNGFPEVLNIDGEGSVAFKMYVEYTF